VLGVRFNGWLSPDDLYLSATGKFSDAEIGNGKVVTLTSTYGGSDRNNYEITGQETTTASILAVATLTPPPPIVEAPIITTALGVLVEYVVAETEQSTGVISAVIPQSVLSLGTMFTIPLPEDVQAAMGAGGPDSITLDGGDPLPPWLKYDIEEKVFKVNGATSESLPVKVILKSGDRSWTVEITS